MLPSSSLQTLAARPRSRSRGTLFIALALQAAVLLVTAFVAVREEAPAEAPQFRGERSAGVEPLERRPSERLREMTRRMARPRTFERLAVEDAVRTELPPAPAMPEEAFALGDLSGAYLSEAGAGLSGDALGGLTGDWEGSASAAEFFGVRDSGRRIVIVVNTSASVVRKAAKSGVSIEALQEETAKLVEGLESGTLFGIVQFSQGERSFGEHLAPALAKNRRLAAEWIRSELRGNPEATDQEWLGHEAGLGRALELRPDLVFLVTDGSLNRRTPRPGGGYSYPKISFAELIGFLERRMAATGARPRLHVVGFQLGEAEREGLRRLASRFGGTLREM